MNNKKIREISLHYDALFSLAAGEARVKNAWAERFLPCWNQFKYIDGECKSISREKIVVEEKYRKTYELKSCVKINGEGFGESAWKVEFENTPNRFSLFGSYNSDPIRKITYFDHFYGAREEIKHIVRIHERMHAFQHFNDFEGVWSRFRNSSPIYKEFLAQVFTFKCVQNTYLEKYFRALSKRQPFIYQTWELVKEVTDKFESEAIVALYLKIKNENRSGIGLLDACAKAYPNRRTDNIINSSDSCSKFLAFERTTLEGLSEFKNNLKNFNNWNFQAAYKKFETKEIDNGLSFAIDTLW